MKPTPSSVIWLYILFHFCKCDYPDPVVENDGHVGNSLVVAGTNPYQVAILKRLSFNFDVIDGKKFVCSGSLIDKQWVLTAAQCVENPNLRIVLGVTNIRVYESYHINFDINAHNIIIHPQYNVDGLENDIALIRLPQPVEFNDHIQPVILDSKPGDHVNETVFLSGWGRISPFTPVADFLRQTTVKIIPNENCQKEFIQPFFYIRCLHLCTAGGLLFSEIGACAGDTGAPLIAFNTRRNRPEQIGIVSKPPFVCKGTEPTIYTRVNRYEEWINGVIEDYKSRAKQIYGEEDLYADYPSIIPADFYDDDYVYSPH